MVRTKMMLFMLLASTTLAAALSNYQSIPKASFLRGTCRVSALACQSAGDKFLEWMLGSMPAAAKAREHTLVTSKATSVEGALAQLWSEIAREVVPERRMGPSLTIVLFPQVNNLQALNIMNAFNKHILACRDCCNSFGRELRPLSLHPSYDGERYRSPFPAFTLSSRIGPSTLRPGPLVRPVESDGDGLASQRDSVTTYTDTETDDPVLEDATTPADIDVREALNALIAGPSAVKIPMVSEQEVMAKTMEWFAVYFARVHRVIGPRQRRLVVPPADGAEEVPLKFGCEWVAEVGSRCSNCCYTGGDSCTSGSG